MSKAMIITIGTGETVAHGICCSIKQHNPDYIAFVLTPESKDKTLQQVLRDECVRGKKWEELTLKDANDVEEVVEECEVLIGQIKKSGYRPADIAVDFTSGTKAMSVGAVVAAVQKRLGTLVYVAGKRDRNGRVISGAERVLSLEPNRIHAESLFRDAADFFNRNQHNSCFRLAEEAESLLSDQDFQEKILLLKDLARAYSAWDKFNLKEAFDILNRASDSPLLAEWGIKSKLGQNKESLYQEKENEFCVERIADLIQNSRRRLEEGKYDDSSARLYRCLEYLIQLRIAQKDLYKRDADGRPDSSDLDLSKIPEELRDKYQQLKDPEDNKVKLGLLKGLELLLELGDELGETYKNQYEKNLKKLLALRNNSILAHGFGSIGRESCEQMLEIIQELTKSVFPDIGRSLKMAEFPAIKLA